jgi:hypothetical protein
MQRPFSRRTLLSNRQRSLLLPAEVDSADHLRVAADDGNQAYDRSPSLIRSWGNCCRRLRRMQTMVAALQSPCSSPGSVSFTIKPSGLDRTFNASFYSQRTLVDRSPLRQIIPFEGRSEVIWWRRDKTRLHWVLYKRVNVAPMSSSDSFDGACGDALITCELDDNKRVIRSAADQLTDHHLPRAGRGCDRADFERMPSTDYFDVLSDAVTSIYVQQLYRLRRTGHLHECQNRRRSPAATRFSIR